MSGLMQYNDDKDISPPDKEGPRRVRVSMCPTGNHAITHASITTAELAALAGSLFPLHLHHRLWLVGGCVRDCLLELPHRDLDLIADLPEETLEQQGFQRVEGRSVLPVFFRHVPGLGNMEIVPLPEGMAIADELRRRDFTVNALAMDLAGQLIDPLDGQSDIQQRNLRACSGRTFDDDPIRLFRALRFEAEGWRMTGATEELIRCRGWAPQLSAMPVERFSREMVKALSADTPERFFLRMLEFNLGKHWLPELFRMPQVPAGPLQYHPEGDLLTHSIQVMQRTASQTAAPLARFCGLFHDIGKLASDPALYPRHHGHDMAGFEPAGKLCDRLRLPAAWGKAAAWTARLHTKANNWHELRDATRIRLASQADRAGIEQILPLVSAADKQGKGTMEGWEETLLVCRMNSADLAIDPDRLAALKPAQRSDHILQRQIARLAAASMTTAADDQKPAKPR